MTATLMLTNKDKMENWINKIKEAESLTNERFKKWQEVNKDLIIRVVVL